MPGAPGPDFRTWDSTNFHHEARGLAENILAPAHNGAKAIFDGGRANGKTAGHPTPYPPEYALVWVHHLLYVNDYKRITKWAILKTCCKNAEF
jgi:hypothetical protein